MKLRMGLELLLSLRFVNRGAVSEGQKSLEVLFLCPGSWGAGTKQLRQCCSCCFSNSL